MIETEYAGHAQEIVRTVPVDDYDGLCAIGGDGTMHELVNGLMMRNDNADIPIGLIPGGTGSSFMHDLCCLDPIMAAERIISGKTRFIDLMKVKMRDETLYAFNVVGWGVVVDIIRLAEKLRWIGYQRYNFATLVQFIKIKQRKAQLIIDGEEQDDDFVFLMGCNTKHTGKGMMIAPQAELDDGLIDLVTVKGTQRIGLLKVFMNVFEGKHLASPLVEYKQVSSLSLIPQENEQLNVDGELTGCTPINVTVVPRGLQIFG